MRTLDDAWDVLRLLHLDVVFAPDMASKLIDGAGEKGERRSWKKLNALPLEFHLKGKSEKDNTLGLLRGCADRVMSATGHQVHFEPLYRASSSFYQGYTRDLASVMLVEDDDVIRVKKAAYLVASEMIKSSRVIPLTEQPKDTEEEWRLYFQPRATVLGYDSALNLLFIRADEETVRDFLRLWEG